MKLSLLQLLTFCLLLSTQLAHAQVDTEFWFVAPEVANGHGDRPIQLRVATLSQAATVTVEMPANASFSPITREVPANSLEVFELTAFINDIENQPADQVLNKGLRVTSTAAITAYYEVNTSCKCNPDIFPLKGANALGTDFFIIAQNHWRNAFGSSSFEIVATENNTTVTISNTQAIQGHGAGSTFTVTLNRGQTYSARAAGTTPEAHLMGSRVSANKPIAITLMDDSMQSSEYGGCADLMGEQMVPIALAGEEYVVMRGSLNGPDRIFILATEDNTVIEVAGSQVGTINAGELFAATFTDASIFVRTTKPSHVLHITGFGCEVGGSILPPIKCTGSNQVSFVRSTSEFFGINIMVEVANIDGFTINGTTLASNLFQVVSNSNGEWASAQISNLSIGVGVQTVVANSKGRFHLGIINGGASTGCRYGYFSSYSKFQLNIAGDPQACPGGTVVLQAEELPDAVYSWTGPNGFTASSGQITISGLNSDKEGTYTVEASSEGCESTPASIDVAMLNQPEPTVTLGPEAPSVCVGETASITANVTDAPASGMAFEWLVNGTIATGASASTFNFQNPTNGDQVQVRLKFSGSDTECYAFTELLSDPVTIAVSTPDPATVTIEADRTEACAGETITFTATANNAGTPTFVWRVNGVEAGTNSDTFSSDAFVDGDRVSVLVKVGSSCTPNPEVTSSPITLTIKPLPEFSISSNSPICPGSELVLTASDVAGGSYEWSGPNGFNATGSQVAVSNASIAATGTYTAIATANGCSSTPRNLNAEVLDQPTPSVSIVPDQASICVGDPVTFTAAVADAPPTGMAFEWLVNGNEAGSSNSTFSSNTLSSSDVVQVRLVFSGFDTQCYPFSELLSEGMSIDVSDPAPASVAIRSNTNRACEGSEVTFTAVAGNAGTPSYQWQVNGTPAGNDSPIFSSTTLTDGDKVRVVMTVGLACSPTPTVTSEELAVEIISKPESALESKVFFCPENGDVAILDARITNAPSASYLWSTGETSAKITAVEPGIYRVAITLPSGCAADFRSDAISSCPMEVHVPNAFSPNGDNRNDNFRLFGENIASIDFKVYNRWGEIVYQSKSLDDLWDGRYLGELVPAGTYFWHLYCTPIGSNEPPQDLKGELTIFRD